LDKALLGFLIRGPRKKVGGWLPYYLYLVLKWECLEMGFLEMKCPEMGMPSHALACPGLPQIPRFESVTSRVCPWYGFDLS
jgi:hypothetical protein